MSLPPITPPPAAAPRSQPRKQLPAAAPRKAPAAAAASAPTKPPGKGRGVPSERSGAFSSSWPSASLQKRLPCGRGTLGSGSLVPSQAAAPGSGQPASASRDCSVLALPGSGPRSCGSLGVGRGGREEAALRLSLSLPPEAVRVLQRRSLEKRRQRVWSPQHASPDAAKQLLAAATNAREDLRALLRVSLLNERHRYDDVEYEEEAPAADGARPVDEGLVRKCTEWLRGVESATTRDGGNKLDTLPHLSTL